jgi:hypothetical protein
MTPLAIFMQALRAPRMKPRPKIGTSQGSVKPPQQIDYIEEKMVPRGGIEPPTRGFSVYLGRHSKRCKTPQTVAQLLAWTRERPNLTIPKRFIALQASSF